MKKILMATLLASASAASFAADTGASSSYIGADLVFSRYNMDVGVAGQTNKDGSHTGGKILFGFLFNPTFGIETGYNDLGSENNSISGPGGTASGSVKSSQWYVSGIAKAPINDMFSVYGKLGLSRMHASGSISGTGFATINAGENKTGVYGAVGAQYNFNKNVSLNLELERLGNSSEWGAKSTAVSTGVRVSF